ncbi:hypothetical protein OOZ54_03190 [Rhodopseudomonas palustris]|uniref:hypothetical protein n=1 Tax=Rhodopseudomonas palustris TaxID=1076 RepID=UPI0022F120F6|nr:hypothetical protein [Rhodopseudomonas palustris]WBU30517.1 hypothetical protein OOZ54_03190 [Rhodopseudomonas palustris]
MQILELLNPRTSLQAVGVEGVRADETPGPDSPTWDGVDVALYFGGARLEQAERVEFVQLKYSSANPEKHWTVSRLTESSAKKNNNSVIRRLADDFKAAKARMKPGTQFKIRFVSNQDTSEKLEEALLARWNGPLAKAGLAASLTNDLKALHTASGLTEDEFSEFIRALDFSETGGNSRFALKESVVRIVAGYLGDDVSSEARDLQMRVRELMLPERANELVTAGDVLLWFGVSGRDGLFPAEPDIRIVPKAIRRKAADDVIKLLAKGERLVLVHGGGGCGKTTLIQQIVRDLPAWSVSITFDCFGGGRYVYADDKRHLPENAFLQLTNDVALALRLPLFVPRNFKYPANIRSFLAKLKTAGQALEELAPKALLVIIIDAADNSIHAAAAATPPERSFVLDLIGSNLGQLPQNIRFIFSSRSGRRDSLQLPAGAAEVQCPLFDLDETKDHLAGTFTSLTDAVIEQFHSLSQHNPRVQNYAIVASGGDPRTLLDVLRPGGKSLSEVLKATFDFALKKLGQSVKFDDLLAALAFLPAPANIAAIARIALTTEDVVRDWAVDLSPGLRVADGHVSIADEDFESFIKDTAAKRRETTISRIADDFLATYPLDAYSALHVADMLVLASRNDQLLSVLERDPQVSAIGDPVLRRQVQVRRLRLALAACQHAGSAIDAVKTILISAEAEKDDSTLTGLLENELDLSVEFGGASLRRTILLDPERVEDHGPFLAHDAARAARLDDRITARENLHFFAAWMRRRQNEKSGQDQHRWKIDESDIAARTEAILHLGGPQAAFNSLMGWTPREVSIRVAYKLVPRLIAAGKAASLRILLDAQAVPRPWDLLLWTALAIADEPVNAAEIQQSLQRLRRRFIPDPDRVTSSYGEDDWRKTLLNTWVASCELGFRLGIDKDVLIAALGNILEVMEGRKRTLFSFDFQRTDALFRCWSLRAELLGEKLGVDQFFEYLKAIQPLPEVDTKEKKKSAANSARSDDRNTRRVNTAIRALFPIYASRVAILRASRANAVIPADLLKGLTVIGANSYEFDRDHDSSEMRAVTARSVMELLIVPSLTAVDIEACARSLVQGRFADWLMTRRLKIWEIMRLRRAEADALLKLVSDAARDVRDLRASGSDKLEAMVRLARLILPVSRVDSEALFNDAIGIAKEIDEEAIDQIEFLSVAAEHADMDDAAERRRIAANAFSFVTAVSERLSSRDFNWDAGVSVLALLDLPLSLAACGRWADDGTAKLDTTLGTVLLIALRRKLIPADLASSLSLLIEDLDEGLFKELALHASVAAHCNGDVVIEEVAKDAILLTSQEARGRIGRAVLEASAVEPMGLWLSCLQRTVGFVDELNREKSARVSASSTASAGLKNVGESKVKTFDFEPKTPFRTAKEMESVLKEASESGLSHSESGILRKMREASAGVDERIPFLNSLASLPDGVVWSATKADAIYDAVMAWKGTPALDRWCRETLPEVLIGQFHSFARWIKQGQSTLERMLPLAGLDATGELNVLLAGVAGSGQALGSRALFGVAELVCVRIDTHNLSRLLSWYSDRLLNRISLADRVSLPSNEIPQSLDEACGRLTFALMSDIDKHVRWRAAHCFRRAAHFKLHDFLCATLGQVSRRQDAAFRDGTAPFYFLAARLWLALATYRISAEFPSILGPFKAQILDMALSPDLPHAGIREYAKRTLAELESAGAICLSATETAALDRINSPVMGETAAKRTTSASFNSVNDDRWRFKFDGMDTLRYWYEDILRIFPTVSAEQVLDIADRWVTENWGAPAEAGWWDREPRKGRYDERRYGRWSHSHGSYPRVERYGAYLEWNAMHCVVGELSSTHPVTKSDDCYDYDRLDYWLGRCLPTAPPEWLSDHRGPTPLELRLWVEDSRTDNGWLRNVRREEFLTEIGLTNPPRPGWLVVDCYYNARFPNREASVRISTALVSVKTAPALVRALQTASNPWDFRIPSESDDLAIDAPPYQLIGWIRDIEGDTRFDDEDPLRYGVSQIRVCPGDELTKMLDLQRCANTNGVWICRHDGEAAFRYEAWCDEPPLEEDYYPRRIRSDGWRLWARADVVQSFLLEKRMDLVCEVQIERRLRSEHGRSYESDAKRKTHDKIILLRAQGALEDAGGHIGAWTDSR